MIRKKISSLYVFAIIVLFFSCDSNREKNLKNEHPKIVNIVNFIRDIEPRDDTITKDTLYETVVQQLAIMRQYHLKGTFLLQYDALIDPKYQHLFKNVSKDSIELGAWWEIPQPMVEKAGIKWRGRYAWDWHANVGFATGYTPKEREKLVDVYMHKFKEVFGDYPQSVASWFIDAHTLNYMYEKYHIVASANCKDQYGTDGYTLWGGYWNQAYYPSKVNSYMPAQHESQQIPVPVFRMLGSDPIRQYDTGLESDRQGVITLEPVYPDAGGNQAWVDWYFKAFVEGEPLAFAYTQAGQENSFIWRQVKKGFQLQMPLIAKLRDEGKLKVETLAASGKWFKKQFKTTPATSVTVTKAIGSSNQQTVWYNSKYYRANILWENSTFRIRDIHVFDENVKSPYYEKVLTSNQASFFTLPVVDGYLWSSKTNLAGLRLYGEKNGKQFLINGSIPKVIKKAEGILEINWPFTSFKGNLMVELTPTTMTLEVQTPEKMNWFLGLTIDQNKESQLPFKAINLHHLQCKFQETSYTITSKKGIFLPSKENFIFTIQPENNNITIKLATKK
ncbi:hypothetical protein ACG2LH_12300 [Zhouia sp. PK063]|uniref:hypothetical protein n=1 Tax=Zhouia sp. PK063 TaxID=3373602 RepID=UPI0037A97526